MNDIVLIFLIMLTLLTVMSAFGGGIRYRENFYAELATDQYFIDDKLYKPLTSEDLAVQDEVMNQQQPITDDNLVFNQETTMSPVFAEDAIVSGTSESPMGANAAPVDYAEPSMLPQPMPFSGLTSMDNYDMVEPFDGNVYASVN